MMRKVGGALDARGWLMLGVLMSACGSNKSASFTEPEGPSIRHPEQEEELELRLSLLSIGQVDTMRGPRSYIIDRLTMYRGKLQAALDDGTSNPSMFTQDIATIDQHLEELGAKP